MAWAIVARRALLPSTPRAQGAPLRASGVDRSARPSKCLSCQQCEKAPLGLPRSIFNRQLPEVSITEICYQFRVSHIGCSPELSPIPQEGHRVLLEFVLLWISAVSPRCHHRLFLQRGAAVSYVVVYNGSYRNRPLHPGIRCAAIYPLFDHRTFSGLAAVLLAWPWVDYFPSWALLWESLSMSATNGEPPFLTRNTRPYSWLKPTSLHSPS